MRCCLCNQITGDPVYIGTLRCPCKTKLCIGRCCKEFVLGHFESIGSCVDFVARVHGRMSKANFDRHRQIFVDLSDQHRGDIPKGEAN